jgi:hypothetical protein
MKSTRANSISLTGISVFACALLLISGCGGASSPSALADIALRPASTTEEIQAQEKAMNDLGGMPPDAPDVRESLRRVLDKSDKVSVRCQAMNSLGQMRDFESGKLMIKALSSEDKMERARAFVNISNILRTKYNFQFDNPDPDERKPGLEQIEKAYKFIESRPDILEKLKAKDAK